MMYRNGARQRTPSQSGFPGMGKIETAREGLSSLNRNGLERQTAFSAIIHRGAEKVVLLMTAGGSGSHSLFPVGCDHRGEGTTAAIHRDAPKRGCATQRSKAADGSLVAAAPQDDPFEENVQRRDAAGERNREKSKSASLRVAQKCSTRFIEHQRLQSLPF